MSTAYFKGEFLPLEEIRVSPLDRGYLFGDGVYEVVPVYGGHLFCIEAHLRRLERSLAAIAIDNPYERSAWIGLLQDLVARNGGGDRSVYFQVTRGEAPRDHAFPEGTVPIVFAMAKSVASGSSPAPVAAVSRQDNRWSRCDIKSIALLPNVLLRQEAVAAGAREAILVREGVVTEGSASNVFVVRDGALFTPPKSPRILAGITRDVVVELAGREGLRCQETEVPETALGAADEIWVTSSTLEISPVIRLNGVPVGKGEPGPVWEQIYESFTRYKLDVGAAPGEKIA
jgi:D-alanine transaminase